MMRVAPHAFAIAIPINPMGPQPKMATLCPEIGSAKTVSTAFPIGSINETHSLGMDGGTFQQFRAGTLTNSAKEPSMSKPKIFRFRQTCILPVLHW
jgi:hypothetical protein